MNHPRLKFFNIEAKEVINHSEEHLVISINVHPFTALTIATIVSIVGFSLTLALSFFV